MAGLFGKLPGQGDFVARALVPGLQAELDAWVSRHLAPLDPGKWPAEGILATIPGALLLSVPSCDAVGRAFPLCAVTHDGTDLRGADAWAAMVLPWLDAAVEGTLDLSGLTQALAPLGPPQTGGPPLAAPRVWAPGHRPSGLSALAALA